MPGIIVGAPLGLAGYLFFQMLGRLVADWPVRLAKLAAWARDRGLSFARAPSLNADDDFVEVLADVARPLASAEASRG